MARKTLNSFTITFVKGKNEKKISVSKSDYERFNRVKSAKSYGKVCVDLIKNYSTTPPEELWTIPKT